MANKTKFNQILIITLVFLTVLSCKDTEKRVDKLEIARQYYRTLDKSSSIEMKALLTDILVTVIPKYNYKVTFSKDDYVEKWLKWDSVFEPDYKVLDMKLDNGVVKAKVSKTDRRILFFMQKPFVTNETLIIKNNKIIRVETAYVNFDEVTWERNRNRLLNWIDENHPELNGFIFDQTEAGGLKFLKAIELYKSNL